MLEHGWRSAPKRGKHEVTRLSVPLANMPALDGMRAIAILIVMLSHTAMGIIIPGGFGVTVFFFLSGFLITTLLRVEAARFGAISLYNFYVKRSLRILPPMLITILSVALLIRYGVLEKKIYFSGVVVDLLFLSNYAPQIESRGGVPIPLWSLDVEEHFYVIFSTLFAFLLYRLSSRLAARLCVAGALAILFIRLVIVLGDWDAQHIFYWSHTRFDSILWGSVLALTHNPVLDRDAWRPKPAHGCLALVMIILCLVIRSPDFRETVRYSLQSVSLLVIFSFVLQADGRFSAFLGSYPLKMTALLSYTLYLSHMPAIAIAEQWHMPIPELTGSLFALCYAGVVYIAVERPIVKWRHALIRVRNH